MQLELDRYQVCELKAIKRFFLLVMIVYAYCDSLSPRETVNLCALQKSARMEIKREVVSRVYSQALSGVPLFDINQELDIG
jgi:hypothetical protein